MTRPLLLVDSDLFILLSAAGLLDELADSLGMDLRDVRRLDPLPHQLRKGKRFADKYPQRIRTRVLGDCDRIQALTDRLENDEFQQAIVDTADIDVGEAHLFALAAERPVYLLASGDKRALRALGRSPALSSVRNALAGRVLCLETALAILAGHLGLRNLAKALTPLRDVNKSIRIIFSAGEATDRQHFQDALDSYLHDLEEDVGKDFLMKPNDTAHGSEALK